MKSMFCMILMSLSLPAFAGSGAFDGKDYSKFCKNQQVSKDGYQVFCRGAANAKAILAAKNVRKVDKIPVNELDAVFDLEILPDADTNPIYYYSNELLNEDGRVVGYLVVSGYTNSEMGIKVQVNQRLNLKGALVSVSLR